MERSVEQRLQAPGGLEPHSGVEWIGGVVQWQAQHYPWRPPTDVLETDDAFLVRLEIAGMDPADFSITLRDRVLTVRGVRRDPLARGCAYHQMEIRFGAFEVLLRLHVPVDAERIEAVYREGFLLITLPKVHPKQVQVEA